MKLMIPFVPHLAHECLADLRCEDTNTWPKAKSGFNKKTEN